MSNGFESRTILSLRPYIALGGPFMHYGWYHLWIGSVILVAFTFLVPPILGQK